MHGAKKIRDLSLLLVMDRVPKNVGFGMVLFKSKMNNKVFLHFCQINFWHIWRFFKVERDEVAVKLGKIIKYAKKLAKTNEEKPFLTCLLYVT